MMEKSDLEVLARSVARFADEAKGTDPLPGLAELGLIGAGLSEAQGGAEAGAQGEAAIATEIGRAGLQATPALECVLVPLLLAGTDLGTQVSAGAARVAVSGNLLDARPDHAGLPFTAFGPEGATQVLMLDGSGALRLAPLPGPARQMIDGRAIWTVPPVDAGTVIAGGAEALPLALARALSAAAADATGAMGALYEMTLAYMRERRQFGQALGSFQTIQFRMVDLSIALEEARALSGAAARALDAQDPRAAQLAHAAWVQAVTSGGLIAREAVQLHGGIGMTEESATAPLVKRLTVDEQVFGGVEAHLGRYRAA
ncbi:acyl-CoA dehydrogenase family protein [Paracoccus aminophilus]|nr:acyl-CoA dehydrogenase family protein [Paracoccus aminophilus]